jgi:hypothetical protein
MQISCYYLFHLVVCCFTRDYLESVHWAVSKNVSQELCCYCFILYYLYCFVLLYFVYKFFVSFFLFVLTLYFSSLLLCFRVNK